MMRNRSKMERSNGTKQPVRRWKRQQSQLKEWKEKLEAFNSKVPTPSAEAPVDIIQEDDSVPHIDLKGQKKTEAGRNSSR